MRHQWSYRPDPSPLLVATTIITWNLFYFASFWTDLQTDGRNWWNLWSPLAVTVGWPSRSMLRICATNLETNVANFLWEEKKAECHFLVFWQERVKSFFTCTTSITTNTLNENYKIITARCFEICDTCHLFV